ncbi:MAG: LLM class flavin-dependent oxidoreductase [Acidimicrobiales bacterium]
MDLGLFFMPLHRPSKPWGQALDEDRRAILHADELGFAEVWVGEHFSTKAEQIPSPLMFLATLINQTERLRFGTGVVNLGHRHPVVVAAEAALFDHLSGGRLMLGVGPGGLMSDGELFGRPEMAERVEVARESIDMILALWAGDAPFDHRGRFWNAKLEDQVWLSHGVGEMAKPKQQPHPPLAMALASPDGDSVRMVAERGFIPISANFVPQSAVAGQWQTYCAVRRRLGLEIDPSIWRVCRNILITESDAEADELVADPDGTFAFYFRYLAGVRDMVRLSAEEDGLSLIEINDQLNVAKAIDKCVIAGSVATVSERLIDMVEQVGPFGTLVAVGHDWDDDGTRWLRSMDRLAAEVAPVVAQHIATKR